MSREHFSDEEIEEMDRHSYGNIKNNGESKILWWMMGILGAIIGSFAVLSWLSLETKVDNIQERLSAMDAKVTLILDGRIRDPNAKP